MAAAAVARETRNGGRAAGRSSWRSGPTQLDEVPYRLARAMEETSQDPENTLDGFQVKDQY